jgi:hypothetical protein
VADGRCEFRAPKRERRPAVSTGPAFLKSGRNGCRAHPTPAEQRPERKIEAAVALMMAIGRAMAEDTNECDLEDFLRNPAIA